MMKSEMDQSSGTLRPLVKTHPAAFWLSVAGLVVQGLSGILIYGAAGLATMFYNVLPPSVTSEWTINGGPFNATVAAWTLTGLAVYTAAVFALGLIGVLLLNRATLRALDLYLASGLVLASSLLAFTTGWGLILGSLLMVVGSIIGFATVKRVSVMPR